MEKRRFLLPLRAGWIKANSGEFGAFRSTYSPELMRSLEEPVLKKQLDHHDRLGLIRDAFAVSEAGLLPVSEALAFAGRYTGETDYTVWVEIASGLGDVNALIAGQPLHSDFKLFARGIFRRIAKEVGWNKQKGEPHTRTLLRALALANFGIYGDLGTIARAKKMFARVSAQKNPVPADLRSAVYSITAHSGSKREYEKMTALYKSATLHEEKNRIGQALAHFPDSKLLARTLAFSLSKHVRVQDTIRMVASVWHNPHGRELAWKFVRRHWKTFLSRYGGQHGFSSLLSPAGSFTTRAKREEIRRFFKTHPAPGAERTIQQVLEKIQSNEAWLKREAKAVETFLRSSR